MITNNNTTRIPFRVSARTAKLIGMENFSTEEGAIIELVKNTYDADAKNCILIFDLRSHVVVDKQGNETIKRDKKNSRIYIIDNGEGMTEDIISNEWMTIGTSNKLYKYSTKGGRVKTGAKGIGRFALNRLGLFTNMQTVSNETQSGYEWIVDWRDFDKPLANVSDVEAILTEIDNLNLKTELTNRFNSSTGISKLIQAITFDSGTILEIAELNDEWEDGQLGRLFSNLEILLPPKEQSDFSINLFSLSDEGEYGLVNTAYYDDFDYKVEASYDKEDDGILKIKVTRNELDVNALETQYADVFNFDVMQNYPYRLEDFKENSIVIVDKRLDEILAKEVSRLLIADIGKFDFTFYFLKNSISDDKADADNKKYPYKSFTSSNRKAWLKRFGGVKIFRDDFRIRPYGEKGDDWLKLGARQAESPGGAGQRLGGYKIRPNQIAGTVKISRIHNQSFQDKSGREGIIENDVFELFKNVIKEVISFFERDRNIIMFHLSELRKQKNEEEETKRKAQEEANKINNDQETNEEETPQNQPDESPDESPDEEYTEREKILAGGVQILTKENEKKDEEIRLLRSLASVGLIISSFAHELHNLETRLVPRTNFLLIELNKYLNESDFRTVDKYKNPFYMIELIRQEDVKLQHWLAYSLSTLKRDKRGRTNLDFNKYFETFNATWRDSLIDRKISLILNADIEGNCVLKAFEIDMDCIFNNLLSNSINALKGYKEKEKIITISWKCIDGEIEIMFSDNGKGLDKKYEEDPNKIFELFESSKVDKHNNVIGTGLGLSMVEAVISDYNNAKISIVDFKQGVTFKINFKASI